MAATKHDILTIGEVAERAGVATSTLRFYESRGLIRGSRTSGNQRRYHRSVLRQISVIRVAQTLGLSLEEIDAALATLPDKRIPTKRDWQRISKAWRDELDDRIERLQGLRDRLTGCIGCGCLSLSNCTLYNRRDVARRGGNGPRYLLGDEPGG